MKDDKLEVVRAWFKKGDNDLRTAEHTLNMDEPPCDTVCFHAQQCAEKYLKGFLAFHEIDFPKIHSIEDIILLCKGAAPSIESDLPDVEILSGYAVESRYPGDVYYEIPEEKAREAIELAKKVKSTIIRYLEGKIKDIRHGK